MSIKGWDQLLDAIVEEFRQLPSATVEVLTAGLDKLVEPELGGDLALILSSVSTPALRKRLRDLVGTCRRQHSPPSHALTFRAAARTDDCQNEHERLELVLTGPAPPSPQLSRSDQVLLELTRSAVTNVSIVTFSAYRAPALHEALTLATQRGASLAFVVESREESGGSIQFDPLPALRTELASASRTLLWPFYKRTPNEDRYRGVLHAKSAIVDERRPLVSSANFSSPALTLKMPLGVLIDRGTLASAASAHSRGLVSSGTLCEVTL